MSRHHFRFCSVAAPDEWLEIPGLGAEKPGDQPERLRLEVRELWPRREDTAEGHAEEHKLVLEGAHDDFELLEEGPAQAGQAADAYRLVYNFQDKDARQNTEYIVAQGPLVCHLTMSGTQCKDERRDRLFEEIASTFTFERNEVIAGARQADLLAEAKAAADLPMAATHMSLRASCISVIIPNGWEAGQDGDADVLRTRGAEIRIARPQGVDNDTQAWLSQRMAEMQGAEGTFLKGWETGEISEDRPYAGISYSRRQQSSQWGAPETTTCLEFVTGDTMLLLWSLTVEKDGWYPGAAAAFAGLLADFEILPGEEWLSRPAEPWLAMDLHGPWISQGPGLYLKQQHGERVFMQTSRLEVNKKLNLAQVRPSMEEVIDTFRGDSPVLQVFAEDQAEGLWRDVEAFRYSLDAHFRDQGVMAVRAVTVLSEGILYTCVLHGTNRDEVHALYLRVLEDLDIPGMADQ